MNEEKSRATQAAAAELQAARAFGEQVEATLNRVATEKAALEQQLATARQPAAPAYPDLRSRVTELEQQLSSASSAQSAEALAKADLRERLAALEKELIESRNFGQQVESTLNRIAGEKAALEQDLAAARQPKSPAYPDLRARVAELESSLAAKPAFPDLRPRVATLEQDLTARSSELAAANRAKAAAESEVAALTQTQTEARNALAAATNRAQQAEAALAAAKSAAPAYPDLRSRVAELETQLTAARQPQTPAYPDLRTQFAALESRAASLETDAAAARTEQERLREFIRDQEQKMIHLAEQADGETKRRMAEAIATANAIRSDLDTRTTERDDARRQLAALTQSAEATQRNLSRELDSTKAALANVSADATAARKQIIDLTSAHEQAQAALAARPAAPAYPDLSARVAELEGQLSAARTAAPAYPDLRARVAELEQQVAATTDARSAESSAQAGLRNRVASLEQELSAARDAAREQEAALARANEAAQNATPRLRELEARVASLTAEAALRQRETTSLAEARTDAEKSRDAIAKQFDEYKDSTAAALRERTTLQANVKLLESDKASLRRQAETAGNETTQLRAQTSTLKEQLAAKPAAPSWPDLRDRVATLESELRAARQPQSPAYPDLSGRVSQLEAELASARDAAPAYPDLRDELASLEQRLLQTAANLSDESASKLALSTRIAQLESDLIVARSSAPAWPDLRDRVGELERQLAAAQSGLSTETSAKSELAATIEKLAQEKATLVSAAAEANRARDEALAALQQARTAQPAYPDLRERVTSLEAELTAAARAVAQRPDAPSYPDLTGRVAELESALADSSRQVVAAREAQAGLQEQLEAARAATPPASDDPQLRRERDELAGRVASLADELAQLRADRERMQKLLADAGRQMRDATAGAARVKELESQLAETTAAADAARQESTRLTQAYTEAETNLRSLQEALVARTNAETERAQRVTELEAELARVEASRPTTPTWPDLRGRVSDLEAELAAANRRPARNAAPAYPDLRERAGELERQLAQASAALSTETSAKAGLAGQLEQLQAELADTRRQLADTQARVAQAPAAPAYPDLRGRVDELEQQLARASSQPADTAAAPDTSDLEQRLAATEDKLATALRGYALLERDRDSLQARAAEVEQAVIAEKDALATQVASLTAEVAQLRATAESQSQAAASASTLSTERDALAARLAQAEATAAAAQAEATRLGETLAALQRSTGQTSTEVANARTLLQQLQGANAVLAQENYQLKTMLARSAGPIPTTAVTAPAGAPVPPPGARIHVVASGDSLSRISQRYYGSPNRWQEIYTANAEKLGPNGVLRIGTELRIP